MVKLSQRLFLFLQRVIMRRNIATAVFALVLSACFSNEAQSTEAVVPISPTPTATVKVLETDTATASPTSNPTPSPTATRRASASDALPRLTGLTEPPTPSVMPTSASDAVTVTVTIAPTSSNTATPSPTLLPITATVPLTATASPLPDSELATPTITPTPVPRTVQVGYMPDFTQAQPHFWFTRPYTNAHATWSSKFYPYGTNNNGEYLWHHGADIQNPQLTPIVAIGDGFVVYAGLDNERVMANRLNFYGQAIIIRHNRPWQVTDPQTNETRDVSVFTLYGHIEQPLVQTGDSVLANQPIALTGQRGVALGPHLHLEVRLEQNLYTHTQNPDLWIRPDSGHGVIAGRIIDANGFYVPQQLITLHRAETPSIFWRQTHTYPDNRYIPDPGYGETFVFADVPVGNYVLKTSFDGHNLTLPITVTEHGVAFVEFFGKAPR